MAIELYYQIVSNLMRRNICQLSFSSVKQRLACIFLFKLYMNLALASLVI